MTGCVAVFDVGKTNIKLVVFDRDGKVVADRSQPNAPLAPDAELALSPARHGARLALPPRRAEGGRRPAFRSRRFRSRRTAPRACW